MFANIASKERAALLPVPLSYPQASVSDCGTCTTRNADGFHQILHFLWRSSSHAGNQIGGCEVQQGADRAKRARRNAEHVLAGMFSSMLVPGMKNQPR